MRVLAVIPARGGSKRLPNKNIRAFCGRPIIAYSLDAAREAAIFSAVHVSTDSSEISGVAGKLGYPPEFLRPAALADDHTGVLPVVQWVLGEYARRGRVFEDAALIMPCAPLLEGSDLVAAYEAYKDGGRRPLMTIGTYRAPPQQALHRVPDGTLEPERPSEFHRRSQDLRPLYYDAGIFAFIPAELVLQVGQNSDALKKFVGFELSMDKAIDINNESDLSLAEILYRGRSAVFQLSPMKSAVTRSSSGAVLRPIVAEDVGANYVEGLNDPTVGRFLSAGAQPQTVDSIKAYVTANAHDPKAILLGIFIDGTLRGTVRIHDLDHEHHEARLGIALFDRSVWGKGHGSSALEAVTRLASEQLGVRRFVAGISSANIASRKAFAASGFRHMPNLDRPLDGGVGETWVLELKGDQAA